MGSAAPKHRLAPLAPRFEPPQVPTSYGKGRGGRPWRRLRAQVLKRDGYLCQCEDCQRDGALPKVADEVDHIVPIAAGGTDAPSNLRAMNHDCHAAKSQREAARGRRRGGVG